MTTTSPSQLVSSSKYYHKNKAEIQEQRKGYYREYNKQRAEEVRNDEEKKLARNQYQRIYRQNHQASIDKTRMPEECLELQVLELFAT